MTLIFKTLYKITKVQEKLIDLILLLVPMEVLLS